mmetsp:Transcript_18528/g.58827  ORF Transcript_18528/g.58827 Transcript_18528/m.58827 type:complete len:148 (-) Transcript_18528:568-1011(-)
MPCTMGGPALPWSGVLVPLLAGTVLEAPVPGPPPKGCRWPGQGFSFEELEVLALWVLRQTARTDAAEVVSLASSAGAGPAHISDRCCCRPSNSDLSLAARLALRPGPSPARLALLAGPCLPDSELAPPTEAGWPVGGPRAPPGARSL